MQIIIPMSGYGERFRRAGYTLPKPLIPVNGKPIITHVIDLFPKETNFIFICNKEHLSHPDYYMEQTLKQYCPTGKIIGIDNQKLGPVFAIQKAIEAIDDNSPTIVNYCDFTCDWDYEHFKQWINDVNPDGCLPCYRGFHPHSLGSTYYGYVKEENLWAQDIQEKKPFTDNPMNEFASSGTYYFKSGKLLKKYCHDVIEKKLLVNNEYYISLAYKLMLEEKKRVAVYELNHFMQWGTPEDLEEYLNWSDIFKKQIKKTNSQKLLEGTLLIPAVGSGSRFQKEGYALPKPLIPVSGKPMIIQATSCLPRLTAQTFVVRDTMEGVEELTKVITDEFPHAHIEHAKVLTEGQASSCLLAKNSIKHDAPLIIAACDSGVIYDTDKYAAMHHDKNIDVIVWVAKGHPSAKRHPEMYGWVATEKDSSKITGVSVKKPLLDPKTDPIVIGTFTFRRAADFIRCAEDMIKNNERINNEFYVDTCINNALKFGLNCHIFEVEHYLSWGTPNELKTFEYWQGCFHYWEHHEYNMELDSHVPNDKLSQLKNYYRLQRSRIPKKTEKMT